MSVQGITWGEMLHQTSAFPVDMRRKLEDVVKKMSPVKDTRDTKLPEKVIKETKSWLEAAGYGADKVDQNVKVPPTKFALDLLIRDDPFWVAGEIETGEGARIELDLLKLMAFARKTPNKPIYGWLLVSDKFLLRTTTGTSNETAFSYVRRVLRLIDLHQSGLGDLLVAEFQTSRI